MYIYQVLNIYELLFIYTLEKLLEASTLQSYLCKPIPPAGPTMVWGEEDSTIDSFPQVLRGMRVVVYKKNKRPNPNKQAISGLLTLLCFSLVLKKKNVPLWGMLQPSSIPTKSHGHLEALTPIRPRRKSESPSGLQTAGFGLLLR